MAILVGSYLGANHNEEALSRQEANRVYTKMKELAPQVCAAQTEDEIRQSIAVLNCAYDTDTPDLENVGDDQVLAFAGEILPKYQGVLGGSPTRGEFVEDFVASFRQDRTDIMEEALNRWTLVWAVVGSAIAFVIASGQYRHRCVRCESGGRG